MSTRAAAERPIHWLQPSWSLLAIAILLAIVGFFVPQGLPLEWCPLNPADADVNSIEITCSAETSGTVQIRYAVGHLDRRPFDDIVWPIGPTTQAFTYVFPLPDAPIVGMWICPPTTGSLNIREMRIIDRRNKEIRRFTRDGFHPQHEINEIAPLPDGWKITPVSGAKDPYARIDLLSPVLPIGQNHRNLLRCLISGGYLAAMLLLILLAVYSISTSFPNWPDFLRRVGFFSVLAILFSVVGNRGLIRNSLAYARYVAPAVPPGLSLEIDLSTKSSTSARVSWSAAGGAQSTGEASQAYDQTAGLQTLRFALPHDIIESLRFDPGNTGTSLDIRGIRLVDHARNTCAVLPLSALLANHPPTHLELVKNHLHLDGGTTYFSPEAMSQINLAIAHSR